MSRDPGRSPLARRLPPLALGCLLVGTGCRDTGDKADTSKPDRPDDSAVAPDDSEAPGLDTAVGSAALGAPWARDEEATPGSITFSEILYHDASAADLEWVELYNPMALDMDLSGWSLDGGVHYDFAEGTVLGAGAYLVVAADPALIGADALGPYEGSLSNDGERIDLISNGGRRMDTVEYGEDDPWPVAADGSGLSLAKRHVTDPSDHAESWTTSAQIGGTPGEDNGIDPLTPVSEEELIALESDWRYDDSGAPPGGWAEPDYDDSGWAQGEAPFYAGEASADGTATLRVTADNYYGLYLGEADGADLRLVAEDYDGSWTTVDSYDVDLSARDHLYIAAWEAPGSDGGPQMVIAEAETDDAILGTSISNFEWILGPTDGCPGTTPPDPAPDVSELGDLLAGATWEAPGVEAGRSSDPWGWAVSSEFDASTEYIWADTFDSSSITNTQNTYALFRSLDPLLGSSGTTELSAGVVTTTFRTSFELDADPAATALIADCQLDDGAVFYLNGVEVLRENMPDGAIDADTLASAVVDDTETLSLEIPTGSLLRGTNTLAVEVHQAEADDADLLFGCALTARIAAATSQHTILLDEVSRASASNPWVELHNTSASARDTTDLVLASSAGEEQVLDEGVLAADARVSVETFPVTAGDVLVLYSADRATVLDAVRVGARARARDDDGDWRTPAETTPGAPNVVETTDDVVINEIMYHHAPLVTADTYEERPEEWIELYNRGDEAVDLSGWQLVDAVAFAFPEGTTLEPDGYLVVSNDQAALAEEFPDIDVVGDFDGALSNTSDRILLLDANGNPADEVRYYDGGRWPSAPDGGGSSLELKDPWADNGVGESWAASDETARTSWESYELDGTADASAVGPDGTWNEFVMGLLDSGEVLIDDLSVVQSPDGSAVEVQQNGSFDDLDHWRIIGNHRHSELVPDPDDPSNTVLRLVATGPTEHMHNHAETTLSRTISDKPYRVSFRARWLSGSNQLHTRLYFNRMPRTTLLTRPELAGTPGAPSSTLVDDLGPTFDDLRQDVAVPAAGEPVEISTLAEDPDGVARVTLWSAVDGGAWTSAEMVESDGRWSASLDGQSAGSVVQFYLEATDGLGQTSTFPAAGADSRALVEWDDGETATNGLHNLRLIMTEADSDWLLDDPNLMSNDALGGTVVYDESEVFYDVGVRTKGSERGRPETLRLGYGVQFPPDHLFRGSHGSALVDRSEGVGYGQREVLLNLVMARAGLVSAEYNDLIRLIAPRSEYTGGAELQLDRSSSLMLANQFADGDQGQLYDYELIYYPYTTDDGTAEGQKLPSPDSVIGTYITDLGDDKESYRWNFELQHNYGQDDYAPMIALGQTFSERGTPAFLTDAPDVIDVDLWLRAFAMATLSGAVDQYGGDSSQHNARFYVRPEDGRFIYFPHDMDFFGSSNMAVVGNTDLYYLIQDPVYKRTYYQHLEDILSRAYNLDYLQPWCDRMGELLPGQDFDYNCSFIADRAAWVESGATDSVAAKFPAVDFAITTNGGADFSTSESVVTLEGQGWIDVREIRLDGEALDVTWLDGTTWQVTVPLVTGDNAIELEATSLGGALVGSDSVGVTLE